MNVSFRIQTRWPVERRANPKRRALPESRLVGRALGRCGRLSVEENVNVILGRATYYFTDIYVSPERRILLSPSDGPIIVFVSGSVIIHGSVYDLTPWSRRKARRDAEVLQVRDDFCGLPEIEVRRELQAVGGKPRPVGIHAR